MHGPSLSAILVVASLGFFVSSTPAGTPDVIEEARNKLARQDGIAAAALLEEALPQAGPSKDVVLDLLQRAYEIAASQALKAGRTRDAETYRENLKILKRKARPAPSRPTPAPEPTPAATPLPNVESMPTPASTPAARVEPTPVLESPVLPTPLPGEPPASTLDPGSTTPEASRSTTDDRSSVMPDRLVEEPVRASKQPEVAPLLPIPASVPPLDVATADAAFDAKNYREAGRIYGALAREKRLPADRRDHWLYCRADGIASRINAKPRTAAEWASINDEIAQMRALNPSFYLSEYLRNLANEIQTAQKKAKPSNTLVVRGSAPEEPATVDRPVRPASNTAPADSVRPTPVLTSNNPAASRIGTNVGRWQILDSKNFRIYHADPALAAKVVRAAEADRLELVKRWPTVTPRGDWSPLCEIYLYPSARQYAQMTGQPEDSPGFSTMGMNSGRISARRINLRADHPTVISAVLPHEITHVILADFFTEKQIPRWADEGLAVLSEPMDEQDRRANDLTRPLAVDQLFKLADLMQMDYPEQRYWSLYYAQSVSLSRFLIEQGTPTQMLQFLQASQQEGYELALRRIYKIEGYADLQDRWLIYAKSRIDRRTADAAPPAPLEPEPRVR
jgi:hypothetical protein